ncbi:unnamed protein product [Ostreobium quekettii]|uniref:Uncharacterized protein n=1 Tax=Ostreobium quekettii TaxID=121088 RepID=A0A8S1ISU0_9CHLO|nr:unnamed protein product [Ostreobium quekettii]
MRLGDNAGARKLLQEKATVSIAQTRADSRAEANITLAAKLSDILRVRQTKLINLYSNKKRLKEGAVGLSVSPDAAISHGPRPAAPIPAINNARHQDRSSGDGNPSAPGSLDDSPSWEDDYESLARSLTEQPFPCEEDLEVAFLALERKSLERMLEISPRTGGAPPWRERKPR